jgi:hypothetical protein
VVATYQVQGFEAYVRGIDEPLTEKFWQYLTIYALSAANTQVTYDFGNYVAGSLGTFWTAAIADTTAITVNVNGVPTATTQGALATQALALIQNIGVFPSNVLHPDGSGLVALLPAASGSGTYAVAIANNAPNITFGATTAPTTVKSFTLAWDLNAGFHGVKSPVTYF